MGCSFCGFASNNSYVERGQRYENLKPMWAEASLEDVPGGIFSACAWPYRAEGTWQAHPCCPACISAGTSTLSHEQINMYSSHIDQQSLEQVGMLS
jgi:hypothetical protein